MDWIELDSLDMVPTAGGHPLMPKLMDEKHRQICTACEDGGQELSATREQDQGRQSEHGPVNKNRYAPKLDDAKESGHRFLARPNEQRVSGEPRTDAKARVRGTRGLGSAALSWRVDVERP